MYIYIYTYKYIHLYQYIDKWKYNAKIYGNGWQAKLILRDIIFGSNISAAFYLYRKHIHTRKFILIHTLTRIMSYTDWVCVCVCICRILLIIYMLMFWGASRMSYTFTSIGKQSDFLLYFRCVHLYSAMKQTAPYRCLRNESSCMDHAEYIQKKTKKKNKRFSATGRILHEDSNGML